MADSITAPYGLETNNPQPEIKRYYNLAKTPYTSTSQVLSQVLPALRYPGQTFNVNKVEYYFKEGTDDSDLVVKTPTASNLGTGAQVFKELSSNDYKFRKIKSANGSVTITEGTDDINLSVAIIDESNLVHKTGNESINGVKTFQAVPLFEPGEINLYDSASSGNTRTIASDGTFYHENVDGIRLIQLEAGSLLIGKTTTIGANILANALTASRNYNLPNQSGTLALTSDLTVYSAGTSLNLSGTEFQRAALIGDVTALVNSNITTIAVNAVTTQKIADFNITTAKIANNAITVTKLPTGATATTFLRGDGTWVTPIDTNTTYTAGTGISLVGTTFNNTLPDQTVALTGAGSVSISGTYPNFTITGTDTNTTYTAGSGLLLTGTVFSNSAPDQVVAITGSGATAVTGTYPNFTISSTDTNTTYTAGGGLSLTGTVFSVENLQKVLTYPADFTGTNYTLTNADNNYEIIINNGATAVSITVPTGLTSKIGVGFTQKGTGNVTFISQSVTIHNPIGLKIKGQYYQTYLSQEGSTDIFYLGGNTKV